MANDAACLHFLKDDRWQEGSAPLFTSLDGGSLAEWVGRVVACQSRGGRPLSNTERALLTYGVWSRLMCASVALVMVRQSALQAGCEMDQMDVVAIGEDPYLRDAFRHERGVRARVRSCSFFPSSHRQLWLNQIRERAATSASLQRFRHLPPLRTGSNGEWLNSLLERGKQKTAAIFFLNRRYLDLSQPVVRELEGRGWRVIAFHYGVPSWSPQGTVSFDWAARAAGGRKQEPISCGFPWEISDKLCSEGPISRRMLLLGMNASWVTGQVQVARHRRVLQALQPQVVLTYGPETMSLALQDAARSLNVPTVFFPHGFLGPIRNPIFFASSASALWGSSCVNVNQIGSGGGRRQGLVATGPPHYDAMLKRSVKPEDRAAALGNFELPTGKRYLIVLFAMWSWYPQKLTHSLRNRTVAMVADALPDDAFLMCKLHPSLEERELYTKLLGEKLPYSAFQVVGETEYRTPDLLAACDVAVANEHSMVLRDAIVMGRLAIAITDLTFPRGEGSCNPLNHPGSAFMGACRLVSNVTELREALAALTRDSCAKKDLLRHRKAYIDRFLVASDGCATQRVADLIEHLASGKEPDSFVPRIGESLLAE